MGKTGTFTHRKSKELFIDVNKTQNKLKYPLRDITVMLSKVQDKRIIQKTEERSSSHL